VKSKLPPMSFKISELLEMPPGNLYFFPTNLGRRLKYRITRAISLDPTLLPFLA
jgi:hypothetical protein